MHTTLQRPRIADSDSDSDDDDDGNDQDSSDDQEDMWRRIEKVRMINFVFVEEVAKRRVVYVHGSVFI